MKPVVIVTIASGAFLLLAGIVVLVLYLNGSFSSETNTEEPSVTLEKNETGKPPPGSNRTQSLNETQVQTKVSEEERPKND